MAIRVAVVGLGPIGNLHARLYAADPLAELVGVCDRIPERAKAAGEKLAVPYFTDAEKMLRALAPDMVSVATGGYEYCSDHYEPTIQALEAGCHVLCEKPICNDLRKARHMVELAKQKRLCLAIDFNHRFTPAAYTAKRWLDEGLLGELLFCNMALWIGKPGLFESVNYHLKALNPHSINMMTWFCGPIETVQCFALKAPGRNIWSTCSWNFRFASGTVGHLTSSYDISRGHPMERCEVAGLKGRLVVEDIWREAVFYPAGNPEKRVYTNPIFGGYSNFDDTFRERLHCFLKQLSEGVVPEDVDGSGEEGLAAQMVIHAGIKSLEEGNRPVRVEEIREEIGA
ncbi:MAG TPA: Gfo/Idh/MocA family oxidoreductase [Firmicutes bacterium]|nr:Gfo/Idh/MocA family oxidoreductase [Bacillota bacterium]